MNPKILDFESTKNLSKLIADYNQNNSSLKQFVVDFHTTEGLKTKIESRVFSTDTRKILVSSIHKQYQNATIKSPINVDALLNDNCYTVTTGHQLCLFGGPKYFIYKIISTLKLANDLNIRYPDKTIVPVFWMASEDHDFDEINNVQVFKKTIKTSSKAAGPVGRLATSTFDEAFLQLKTLFENDAKAIDLLEIFQTSFSKKNWASATRYWVHQLFGDELIIIDGDDANLKSVLAPILKDEVTNNLSEKYIESTSQKLLELGYHAQVTPRAINLFYIENGLRELIMKMPNDTFSVKNTDKILSQNELLKIIDNTPHLLSPNVALRPIYQEVILPNIAYVGGPGELAYWLQLKSNFDRLNVSFPILVLRDSFLLVSNKELQMLDEMNLNIEDVFLPDNELIKKYIQHNTVQNMFLDTEQNELLNWQNKLSKKLSQNDKDFEKFLGAEFSNWNKLFIKIDQKLLKSEKQKQEVAINRLLKIKTKWFPNNGLNERVEAFIPDFLNSDNYLHQLLQNSDVAKKSIKVIVT